MVTSDRDSFQLASEHTTILQPTRGVSELARVGPAEVRERYGVDPEQVPDFIALRGDPSDKLPGAKGVGPKTAASLLAQYGTLEAMLEDGRFEVAGGGTAACTGEWRHWTPPPPYLPLTTRPRTGRRRPPSYGSWA